MLKMKPNDRVSAASGRRAQPNFGKEQPIFQPAFPESAANALFGVLITSPHIVEPLRQHLSAMLR